MKTTCPECGMKVSIRRNARLNKHTVWVSTATKKPKKVVCPGSGKKVEW